MEDLTNFDIQQVEILANTFREKLIEFGPKVILAIIVLILGRKGINTLSRRTANSLKKSNIDVGLRRFAISGVKIALKILLLISVASMIGIETTSFVAVIGAAGLAIGLALQGSLENFAGGVLILLFKPYTIGDYIEVQGEAGSVENISVFTTTLLTPDKVTKIIPNGKLANGNITNYTKHPTRRIEITVGVEYDADIKKTKKILTDIVTKHEKIHKEPAPQVALTELADSSVNRVVRPHVDNEDYRDVYFELMEQIKQTLDTHQIGIPYPHQVIEIKKS